MYFGAYAVTAPTYALEGQLDDIAIFDTAKEIGDVYDSTTDAPKDLSEESGLVGYWVFDDATFNPFPASFWTIPDKSTNANSGISAGMIETDLLLDSPKNINSGTSSAVAVEDVINNAPSNEEQGVSDSMDIEDRETDAPDNENQANSVSMRETAPPDGRSTDVPT